MIWSSNPQLNSLKNYEIVFFLQLVTSKIQTRKNEFVNIEKLACSLAALKRYNYCKGSNQCDSLLST